MTLTEASMSGEEGFAQQQEVPERRQVYDFLYHDVRRLSSFLAQFETYGVLQNIKASELAGSARTTKAELSAKGGVPLVAQGEAGVDRAVTKNEQDAAERSYDPLWTIAGTLLAYLDEHSLINLDVTTAHVGQFVQVTGQLTVVDFSILKTLLNNNTLKKLILKNAEEADPAHPSRNQRRTEKTDLNPRAAALEIVPMFPLTAQATFNTDDDKILWATLDRSAMTVQPEDLLLQHGVSIAGSWMVLGILDSKPENNTTPHKTIELVPIASSLASMIPMIRGMLGKPSSAYGITPLLIFRQVSG